MRSSLSLFLQEAEPESADYEREINGVWRGSGVKNLYLFAGNLALCRFNSKLVALQIKAQLDEVFREEDRCELE